MTGPWERPKPFRAPEHTVTELARLIENGPPAGPRVPPRGTPEYAELLLAEARRRADLDWSEAFAAGAQFALEMAATPQMVIGVEEFGSTPRMRVLPPDPLPFRMSVIRPEEYRPDRCPQCAEPVVTLYTQHPVGDDAYGTVQPADRVMLKPCSHVIRFIDDTQEARP